MAYCNNCGTQVNENAKFCENCGQALNNQKHVFPPYYNYQYPQYQYTVKPKVPGRGFGITSMVLGIIGLIYAFYIVLLVGSILASARVNSGYMASFLFVIIFFSSLSIMASAFSAAAKNRGYVNSISASGTIMGVIGLIIYSILVIMVICLMPLAPDF